MPGVPRHPVVVWLAHVAGGAFTLAGIETLLAVAADAFSSLHLFAEGASAGLDARILVAPVVAGFVWRGLRAACRRLLAPRPATGWTRRDCGICLTITCVARLARFAAM